MGITDQQVKQHRSGNDRDQGGPDVQTDALRFQPAHHAAGCVQSPGAAAREQNGMHRVHRIARIEQVGLARARCSTSHVHAGDGAAARQHHAAAGGPAGVGEMADLNAGHVGDGACAIRAVEFTHGVDYVVIMRSDFLSLL